jgi:hypothetical protein
MIFGKLILPLRCLELLRQKFGLTPTYCQVHPYSFQSFQKYDRSNNMILDWFNAGEAVLFAQKMVRDINRLFPPTEQKGKAIPAKVYQQKFDSLVVGIRTFSKKNKLNIYKKAKLLNTIKWEMKDAGHEELIINEFISFIAPLL